METCPPIQQTHFLVLSPESRSQNDLGGADRRVQGSRDPEEIHIRKTEEFSKWILSKLVFKVVWEENALMILFLI